MEKEGKAVPVRVWRPDGSVVKVTTITNARDHFGNLVAEGFCTDREYWEGVAKDAEQGRNYYYGLVEKTSLRAYSDNWVSRFLDYYVDA